MSCPCDRCQRFEANRRRRAGLGQAWPRRMYEAAPKPTCIGPCEACTPDGYWAYSRAVGWHAPHSAERVAS